MRRVELNTCCCASAQELVAELEKLFEHLRASPKSPNSFLLLWGPPAAGAAEFEHVCKSIPPEVPVIAASARESFTDDRVYKPERDAGPVWHATILSSPYFSPHAAAIALPDEFTDVGHVKKSVQDLVEAFPEPVRERYFCGKSPAWLLGSGYRQVVYRRPAILFLLLPGTSGRSKAGEACPWPLSNMDYEIVEEIGSRVALNVGVFGGSAAGDWPTDVSAGAWVASSSAGRRFGRCIAALLVETDLRFGLWCSHGFTPQDGVSFPVLQPSNKGDDQFAAPRIAKGFPECHHLVRLKGLSQEEVDILDDPGSPKPAIASLLDQNSADASTSLVHYEAGEVLPNPPYKYGDAGSTFQLLRAVPLGASMYAATTTWRATVAAMRESMEKAQQLGQIEDVACAVTINCRGRLHLLSPTDGDGFIRDDGPKAELEEVREWQRIAISGFYGDGETCSTPDRTPLHRNWTVASLVFGHDLNPRYVEAATRRSISQLEQCISDGPPLSAFATRLVDVARDILEVSDCHVRLLDPVHMNLTVESASGDWSKVVPSEIDVAVGSPRIGLTSYDAFQRRTEPVVCSQSEARQKLQGELSGWGASNHVIHDLLRQRSWFVSYPIFDGAECLGVLSVASTDPDYLKLDHVGPALKVLQDRREVALGADLADGELTPTGVNLLAGAQIARAIAIHVRNALMRQAEASILQAAINAKKIETLAHVMDQQAGALLGQGTYLTLMVPTKDGTKLRSASKHTRNGREYGPEELFVELDTDDKHRLGITGWVFRHGEEVFVDDVSKLGAEDKWAYKRSIGDDIQVNYAVPITDSVGRAIAVLNAEAPKGAMTRLRHIPAIHRLAHHCKVACLRIQHAEVTRRRMKKVRRKNADLREKERLRAGLSLAKWARRITHPSDALARNMAVLMVAVVLLIVACTCANEVGGRFRTLALIGEELEDVRADLSVIGDVNSEGHRAEMRRLLEARQELHLRISTGYRRSGSGLPDRPREPGDVSSPESIRLTDLVWKGNESYLSALSSEVLVDVIMICFGIVGALAWFVDRRVRESESLLRLMLVGLFGGITALVLVQGGKQVFLSASGVSVLSFNPWTSGILALFAGLAAYRTNLLTLIVDEISVAWRRIR